MTTTRQTKRVKQLGDGEIWKKSQPGDASRDPFGMVSYKRDLFKGWTGDRPKRLEDKARSRRLESPGTWKTFNESICVVWLLSRYVLRKGFPLQSYSRDGIKTINPTLGKGLDA